MNKRTLLKTLSWQTVSTIVAILTAWWYFGDFNNSIGFVIMELCIFSMLYYIHDVIWLRVDKYDRGRR